MGKFKVGDKVICRKIPINAAVTGPGWTTVNISLIGKVIEIWQVDDRTSTGSHIEWYRAGSPSLNDWWDVSWLESATVHVGLRAGTPPPIVFKCTCQILQGCRCGIFRKEMESKGKIYNHVMGYWTNK